MTNNPTKKSSTKVSEIYTNDFFNILLDEVINCISETLNFPNPKGATFVFAPRVFVGYPDINGDDVISWATGIPAEYFEIKDTNEKFAAFGRWHYLSTGEGACAVVYCEPVPDVDGKTKIVLHLSTFTQHTAVAVLYLGQNDLGNMVVTTKQIVAPVTDKLTPLEMNPLMSFFHAITEEMNQELAGDGTVPNAVLATVKTESQDSQTQGKLKVLVSTKELQGIRTNDFSHATEGELVKFGSECDREEIDGTCGCRRAFAGFDSLRASTTAKVIEVDMTPETFKQRLHESEIKAGWLDKSGDLDPQQKEYLDGTAKELLDLASHFPVGMVVEKRGDTIQERLPDAASNNIL